MNSRVCWKLILPLVILGVFLNSPAYASGGIPALEQPLQRILNSISGPILAVVATLSIIVFGLALTSAREHGFDRLTNIVLGLSFAFGAATLVATIWGGSVAGNTPTVPQSSTIIWVMDTLTSFGVHSWLTYLYWRLIRYVQQFSRAV